MRSEADRLKLIVALDVSSSEEALGHVDELKDWVGYFKVGLQLFLAEGPDVVGRILERGGRVFLDLKLHDIPNTVGGAAESAVRMGVQMLTLHTSGGLPMMQEARRRVDEIAGIRGERPPLLLGVTVLTSFDGDELARIGLKGPIESAVLRLARLASTAGLDGVVASPREIRELRGAGLRDLVLVIPGIRPEGSDVGDQRRTGTPGQALRDGADFLVVGRPILNAASPWRAARKLVEEIARARMNS